MHVQYAAQCPYGVPCAPQAQTDKAPFPDKVQKPRCTIDTLRCQSPLSADLTHKHTWRVKAR